MGFGEQVRSLRLAKGIQQKQLADLVGIEVTYLSKIEMQRVPPPSEETIRLMAEALETNSEPLILAAAKVPSGVKDVILGAPKAPEFLRTARHLGDEEWDQLIAMAARLARSKKK